MFRAISIFCIVFCFGLIECGHWAVSDQNHTCIIMDANITVNVKYSTVDNKTRELSFNVTETKQNGSCDNLQNLTISFYPFNVKNALDKQWNMTIFFMKRKDESFVISNYTLEAFIAKKYNASESEQKYHMDEHSGLQFGAIKDFAYKCSGVKLYFTKGTIVNLKGLKLIAYAQLNATSFSGDQNFEICAADMRTTDIVPIVVGACLACLVLVVLVAYLVGRARAKRQGYASV